MMTETATEARMPISTPEKAVMSMPVTHTSLHRRQRVSWRLRRAAGQGRGEAQCA